METVLNNIEIILSMLGLVIIRSIPAMIDHRENPWTLTAVVATSAGVLHGVIFWLIRRRQRLVRNESMARSS